MIHVAVTQGFVKQEHAYFPSHPGEDRFTPAGSKKGIYFVELVGDC